MADENPDVIDEILLSLQANDEDLLPTLTLYTGERLPSDPKPPLNLHLSLGGSYTENSNKAAPDVQLIQESAAVEAAFVFADNSASMMKRSYLEQNKMAHKDLQEEIILIDNVPGITAGSKQKSKIKDTASDVDWAAQSASKNPALMRALQIIKSDGSQPRTATRTNKADHNQGDTSNKSHAIRLGAVSQPNDLQYDTCMSHAIQGDAWQPEIIFQAAEGGNSMNPDDFLSISPISNGSVNVDIGLSLPSNQGPSKKTSAACSMIPPAVMNGVNVTANAEYLTPENLGVPGLFPPASDKGKSVMIVEPTESATIWSTPITKYYGCGDENLITNFCTSKSEGGVAAFATASSSSRISNPYMILPQGAIIGSGNTTVHPTCYPNINYPTMSMANPVPPSYMSSPSTSSKENAISNLMHYDPYMLAAVSANANSLPAAAFAFPSNQWANASIPVAFPISGGFPTCSGSNSSVVIPPAIAPPVLPAAANGHPLMKRNEYQPDSQTQVMRHMPTVATDGGIPDGRRIEGLLYQYSKYEEVIIVCFCHGSFFSPREFVMHAGGAEVENPMRLITIVPDHDHRLAD